MAVPRIRRILIDLLGARRLQDLHRLSGEDWDELDRIAAMHRLQPLLHANHGGNPALPAAIAATWKDAHRAAAMQALAMQAELVRTVGLLEAAGHQPVALKGAWLAHHAYPHPALRPMRDIDLLVAADGVLDAFDALHAAGYVQIEPAQMALADVVRLNKHLPPLMSPGGTVIELHHRLWEPDGRLGHASPRGDEAAMRLRAISVGGLRFLAPQDLLAHLIVHAVYSHQLDCGPLVLPDIACLLDAAPIDWPQFWDSAHRDGWRDGARLVLELVQRSFPAAPVDLSSDRGNPAPPKLVDAAPDLLLQELDSRASAQVVAASLKGGAAALFTRVRGQHGTTGEKPLTRDMQSEGGRLGWVLSRAWRTLRDVSRSDTRQQARNLAALSSWLDR